MTLDVLRQKVVYFWGPTPPHPNYPTPPCTHVSLAVVPDTQRPGAWILIVTTSDGSALFICMTSVPAGQVDGVQQLEYSAVLGKCQEPDE